MDTLFKKALVITDLHLGRSGGSVIANQDSLDFLAWAIDRAKSWGAETAIFCGDWHDNRHSIQVSTLHSSVIGLEMLNTAFKKTWLILGNHDLFYRDSRDISSIAFSRNLPNLQILTEPTTFDDVTFLPWLVGEEQKTVKHLKSRYAFAHLEMAGFAMNSSVIMPDNPALVKPDQFTKQEFVFTGHFHKRQHVKVGKTQISYIGSALAHNFSDNWDADRGAMFLEWGKDPIYEAWPEQPLFRTMKLSEMLETPGTLLLPKMTVRASVDLELAYEEAQEIRDALMTTYGLRKIELVQQASKDESEQAFDDANVVFQSVDQIVEEGLRSVDSVGLSRDRLVEIYRALVDA